MEFYLGLLGLFGYRTLVAEWASIVSLFVTAYVAITIFTIRKQFLARATVPALLAGIEENTKRIASLMQDFEENKNFIGVELAVCESRLRAVRGRTKGQSRSTVQEALKTIGRYRGKSAWRPLVPQDSAKDAWHLYYSLNAAVEGIKQSLEDQRLGG